MDAQRIVSLLPSATEIVFAVGAGDRLVGRSHECDFPPGVSNLPACTSARINSAADSGIIDREVKGLIANALSIYEVDVPLLEKLSPDLIVTQDQCDVCAVSREDVEAALSSMTKTATKLISLTALNLAGVWADIERTADAVEMTVAGQIALKNLQDRTAVIANRAQTLDRRPSVVCIEWTDPLMVAGNWVPELIDLAAGIDLLGKAGAHSPYVDWETLRRADPDIIIGMPCGFGLERTRQEMDRIADKNDWGSLKAVREGQVFITDGNQYFNRPGPRLVESLEILAEIFRPEIFDFGHRGRGWERF